MHLVEGRTVSGQTVDSARQNLASTFVNGFVNAGFGVDKLMTAAPGAEGPGMSLLLWHSVASTATVLLSPCCLSEHLLLPGCCLHADSTHWIFKNKDHGKTSATASLGLVMLWDVESGLPQIDKYMYSQDPFVVAGALLAVGIVNCGVQDECDPAYALLYEHVNSGDASVRVGAILGLGLAYACTEKVEVRGCGADTLHLAHTGQQDWKRSHF
jgi:26S proteasome regulatory subunit N1